MEPPVSILVRSKVTHDRGRAFITDKFRNTKVHAQKTIQNKKGAFVLFRVFTGKDLSDPNNLVPLIVADSAYWRLILRGLYETTFLPN